MKIIEMEEADLPELLLLQKKCCLQEAKIYNDYKIQTLTQTIEAL